MMDPPINGSDTAADVVMMDPQDITNSSDAIVSDETTYQGPATDGLIDVVVPVQDTYDYTNYQELLSNKWPAMTQTCVDEKHKFNPLTQKRVYTVGMGATAGVDTAWLQYNLTFTKYLNAVVGPRFDPPIQFEMAVTTRPLNDWVSQNYDW
jgi:hypothetical protein